MDRLSLLLPKTLRKRGLKQEADASLLVHYANQWLRTKKAPEDVHATMLKEEILIIETESPSSAQECQGMTEDILEYVRKECTGVPIRAIRIVRA